MTLKVMTRPIFLTLKK